MSKARVAGIIQARYGLARHPGKPLKAIVDLAGNARYFSRSLIPYPRGAIKHTVYEKELK